MEQRMSWEDAALPDLRMGAARGTEGSPCSHARPSVPVGVPPAAADSCWLRQDAPAPRADQRNRGSSGPAAPPPNSRPCGCAAHRPDENNFWEGCALPNPSTGWGGMGKPGFPTPLLKQPMFTLAVHAAVPHNAAMNIRLFLGGRRPPQPSRGRGCGETGFPHTPVPAAYVHVSDQERLRGRTISNTCIYNSWHFMPSKRHETKTCVTIPSAF